MSNNLFAGSNFFSTRARTEQNLTRSLERLGSGLRINSAKDDAAGLALADRLSVQKVGLQRAQRNLNDSISHVSIAEEALLQLSNIVTQITEIATQVASSSLTSEQAGAVEAQAKALRTEYNRIVSSTTFNGQNIFDSAALNSTAQAGAGSSANDRIQYSFSSTGTTLGTNGTFQAGVSFSSQDYPYQIILSDLNGDGNDDLVVSEFASTQSVGVSLGNGDGTFGTRTAYSIGATPRGLVVEDLTGDGNSDILVTSSTSGIQLLTGNGDGTFASAATISSSVGTNTSELVAADFTGDGLIDFVHSASTYSTLYVGDGTGSFAAGQSIAITGTTFAGRQQSIGDVDGDGDVDLVLSSDTATFLYRNSGGTFSSAVTIHSGGAVASVQQLADIDNDNDLDMIIAFSNVARIYTNNGSGTYGAGETFSLAGTGVGDIVIADVTGDGEKDIVSSASAAGFGLYVYRGNGNATFGSVVTTTYGSDISQLEVGDINNDGILDIVGGGSTSDVLARFIGNASAIQKTTRVRYLEEFSIIGPYAAQEAQQMLEKVSTDISLVQGAVSGAKSRLESAVNYVFGAVDVAAAAVSRIRDVDYADELANYTKLSVLSDQQTAIAAQANENLKLTLALFQDL